MQVELAAPPEKATRHYFIDWLRVGAVAGIFVLHSTRFFAPVGAPIENVPISQAAFCIFVFLHLWIVPMLFLLAGMSAKLATATRAPAQFLRERMLRLVIPYFFGVIFLAPPLSYIGTVSRGIHHGPFLRYWAHSLISLRLHPSPKVASQWGNHLWFLAFLFVYSLLGVPLLNWLRGESGQRFARTLGDRFARGAALFLPVLPLAAINLLIRLRRPAYCDWGDFSYWFLVFLFGIVLMSDPRLVRAVARQKLPALLLAGGCFALMVALHLTGRAEFSSWLLAPTRRPKDLVLLVLWALTTWSWLLFFLGLGMDRLEAGGARLRYANEAALPFYMLHQPVLFAIGFFVVQWSVGVPVKLATLAVTAFLVTLLSYEVCVRRIGVLRFLFGMRPARR